MIERIGAYHADHELGAFVVQHWMNADDKGYWALFEKVDVTGSYLKMVMRDRYGFNNDPEHVTKYAVYRFLEQVVCDQKLYRYNFYHGNVDVRRVTKKEKHFIVGHSGPSEKLIANLFDAYERVKHEGEVNAASDRLRKAAQDLKKLGLSAEQIQELVRL